MKPFLFVSFLICSSFFCTAQKNHWHDSTLLAIRKGELPKAQSLLSLHEPSDSAKLFEQIDYLFLKGEFHYTNGNFESAINSWNKTRKLIHESENQGQLLQYHNYLSTYYYELQNPNLIRQHNDSALELMKHMSNEETSLNRGYLTWILEGLSLKITRKENRPLPYEELYKKIQFLLNKSIDFQIKNHTDPHDLARTHHRLANTYTDLFHNTSKENDSEERKHFRENAVSNYDKAIEIWTDIYGEVHHERARSLYVKAFMNYYMETQEGDLLAYSQAFSAFGLSNSGNIKEIPNKLEVLMFLKYYTKSLLFLNEKKSSKEYRSEATRLNALAIEIWGFIQEDFQNKNISRDIAIYSLNPFLETLQLQFTSSKVSNDYDEKLLFKALQKCKYNDIEKPTISLSRFQSNLEPTELFCDFLPEINNRYFGLFIDQDKTQLIEFTEFNQKLSSKLKKGIIQQNFDKYSSSAYKLYDLFFSHIDWLKYHKLTLSTSGYVQDVPFSALLISEPSLEMKEKYDKLSYLKDQVDIRFILSSAFVNAGSQSEPLTIDYFTPELKNSNYTSLPFSELLGNELTQKYKAKTFQKENCSKNNFLTSKNSITHISSHAQIENSLYTSKIILSDTVLRPKDLILLVNPPKLAVLNTCNSHLGINLIGEGTNGFVREFMKHGTVGCVSNLWEVDDQASNQLFSYFYSNLHEGKSVNYALQNAKKQLSNSTNLGDLSAPFYWAGHRYVGADLVFYHSKSQEDYKLMWFFYFLILLVIGITAYMRFH